MKTMRVLLAMTFVPIAVFLVGAPAGACTGQAASSMTGATASVACEMSAADLLDKANGDTEAVYTIFPACLSGAGMPDPCFTPNDCNVGDKVGLLHGVRRNGLPIGTVCVTAGDPTTFTPSLPVLVAKRFKALEWPQSTLSVQPRDGKTLVNIETIFYTTNNQPTSKTVTLLGQQVEIEATPTSYTWHFGDDTSSSTSSAGHAYPDHDVFHVYTGLDPVKPSVDTIYSGRFRVNGGEWENIEDTLTVAGARVDLEILEASPELVTDPGE